jgi:hypothetical protein
LKGGIKMENIKFGTWIKCKDRYPNMEEVVKNNNKFIVSDGKKIYCDSYDYHIEENHENKWIESIKQPTYWMNFPDLPME